MIGTQRKIRSDIGGVVKHNGMHKHSVPFYSVNIL
jgi:hypothetical protein